MMSGMPLETCLAFNERWNNKFYYKVASCSLFLLIHTMIHGSMNIKCTILFIILPFLNVSVRYPDEGPNKGPKHVTIL